MMTHHRIETCIVAFSVSLSACAGSSDSSSGSGGASSATGGATASGGVSSGGTPSSTGGVSAGGASAGTGGASNGTGGSASVDGSTSGGGSGGSDGGSSGGGGQGGFTGCEPSPGCDTSLEPAMGCASVGLANCTHAASACCIPAEQQQTAACNCFSRCAAPDTPIATPSGERAIATLEPGDLVYSVVGAEVRAVPIRRVQRVEVHDHEMVRVGLSDGGVLHISPGHPTADGRVFGDLGTGDSLDGVTLTNVTRVKISKGATYDILPDSDTGTYFAGSVLIGSTLAPVMPRACEGENAALTRMQALSVACSRATPPDFASVLKLRTPITTHRHRPSWRSMPSVSVTDQSSTISPSSNRLIVMPLKRTRRPRALPSTTNRDVTGRGRRVVLRRRSLARRKSSCRGQRSVRPTESAELDVVDMIRRTPGCSNGRPSPNRLLSRRVRALPSRSARDRRRRVHCSWSSLVFTSLHRGWIREGTVTASGQLGLGRRPLNRLRFLGKYVHTDDTILAGDALLARCTERIEPLPKLYIAESDPAKLLD